MRDDETVRMVLDGILAILVRLISGAFSAAEPEDAEQMLDHVAKLREMLANGPRD